MGTNITGIGNANAIGFKSRVTGGIYFPPELKDALVGVWSAYGKSNDSTDRNIIKNKIKDRGGDFVISNAAYTEGSGYADKGSPYYGAFVTDGIDDLITSTKTVQEMLGGSNEITVVSMMANLDSRQILCNSNYSNTNGYNVRNTLEPNGVISMLGYTDKNGTTNNINLIMGDKDSIKLVDKVNFNSDYVFYPAQYYKGYYQVAWYWTIIANKVLTTDQINQVIAYFNLDKTLKPDILCNIGKQGITNDNHADFNDKLVDYSGNGRDIQMYNLAWKGGSGVAAKKFETIKDYLIVPDEGLQELTIYNEFSYKVKSIKYAYRYWTVQSLNKTDVSYPITIIADKDIIWKNILNYTDENGVKGYIKKETNVPANVPTQIQVLGFNDFDVPDNYTKVNCVSYAIRADITEFTVTFIPSYKGGILLDGVNDYGKVTGLPIYKDYTVIADYERTDIGNIEGIGTSPVLSKSYTAGQGSFIMNFIASTGNSIRSYSFGTENTSNFNDLARQIFYQSKYKNQGFDITAGTGVDGDSLWLGTARDNDSRFFNGAIYSLMTFPYSMSEFLIERQLKKHKLGTLYPDMVEFRPVIKSNASYDNIVFYYKNEKVENGTYLTVGSSIGMHIRLSSNSVNEIKSITVNGIPATFKYHDANNNIYQYDFNLTSKSLQKINITIDEYIRYEDIVQPYPALLRFNDENGNEVSWGGKFKVGSTITRIGSAADSNLLPNIYNIFGLLLNGNQVTSSKVIVEKTMVFKAKSAYIFDNNEPKCILSPRLLRIPNSSYKILGYIPDISGHGNHGKINNSAYASMSGANGYLLDFKTFTTGNSSLVNIKDDSRIEVININKEKSTTFVNLNKSTSISLSSWKIKLTGMKSGDTLGYYYSESTDATLRSKFDIKSDGIYSLPSSIANSNNIGGIAFDVVAGADSAYRIEQIGEYEGAYCLDGVDDFVTIPTVTGGKQVLMKVNWQSDVGAVTLYDQRLNISDYEFAIYNGTRDLDDNPVMAYQGRNNGQTYIDGILNSNIMASELKAITHNITITNELSLGINNTYPVIGSTRSNTHFAQMALYDFMLFDEISTDDKIKELNEYVGIEAKVELPPYYWDTYGKTNSDADRDTIQQRGVAVGDYDLTNYNHAYEGMSGYNGYPVVFGANKTWTNKSNGYVTSITSNTIHITNVLNAGLALLYSYVKYNGNLQNIKEIPPFKIEIKGLEGRSKFIYKYLATSDATKETNLYLGNGTHELPKSFLPTEALVNDTVVGFSISPIEEGVTNFLSDITIEVLPEYENGLAYDGVSDFTDNKNIPILTDFTFIIKREILGLETNGSMLVIKGDKVYNNGIGNAFILEHNSNGVNYVYSYGKLNQIKRDDSKIIYLTPESYNGNPIIKGENGDNLGLVLSRHWRGIIYKTILYSKTMSLLEINFLKNLMERDEIIDLNNPIFIQE